MYHQFEKLVDWNRHVSVAEITCGSHDHNSIQLFYHINEHTDLVYIVSTETGDGIISN